MKKIFSKLVLIASLFFVLSAYSFAENATVTAVKGKVEVSHGDDNWIALKVGDTVSESDIVSTGFQSEAKIKYNGSIMLMGALTRVTLSQLSSTSSKDNVDVFLNTGAVRSKVTHTSDKKVEYKVRSQVAVASVRGTEFIVRANGIVECFSGAVAVCPAKYYVDVDESSDSVEEAAEESAEESKDAADSGSEEVAETSSDEAKTDEPATATTSAKEISSSTPDGSVVVAENQATKVNTKGLISKPIEVKTTTINKVKTQVSTEAEKETVSLGTTTEVITPAKTTGTISVTIEFDEE